MSFPVHRPRRLRRSDALRGLVRETRLSPQQLIAPLFVCEGEGVRREIGSMPGCFHLSVDALVEECRTLAGLGVAGVILFGIPDAKHPDGHAASDPAGPVARGLAAVRAAVPALSLWADVCLCEYTDHGHCGPIATAADGLVEVDNDATLPLLSAAARAYAEAGADVVAPSDMMDGRVGAIRTCTRFGRTHRRGHRVLCREVRVGLLRAVSRGRGVGPELRRSPRTTRWTRATRSRRCAR